MPKSDFFIAKRRQKNYDTITEKFVKMIKPFPVSLRLIIRRGRCAMFSDEEFTVILRRIIEAYELSADTSAKLLQRILAGLQNPFDTL